MSPSADGRTDAAFARALLERPDAFCREDGTDDAGFYRRPRLVSHLDATALTTVERLVDSLIVEEDPVILDLMASGDSHLPPGRGFTRVTGLGMNEEELRANPALAELVVHDLNLDPSLPFADGSFAVVLNVVSVEYLTRPFQVFSEVGRVLKPGGLFLVVFSTRWFPPKVVRAWAEAKEEERIGIVEEFFRRTESFESTDFFISMGLPRPQGDRFFALGIPSDPVFAVYAERIGGALDRQARRAPEDPARIEVDWAAVARLKETVGDTLQCPYCHSKLSKWAVPDDPCIDWPNDYLYLCFNDACPFLVRGWRHMWNQGISGVSYRFLFDPITGGSSTVPIRALTDLRAGIVEEDPAGPFRSALEGGLPDFSGLPPSGGYGPGEGGPRG